MLDKFKFLYSHSKLELKLFFWNLFINFEEGNQTPKGVFHRCQRKLSVLNYTYNCKNYKPGET